MAPIPLASFSTLSIRNALTGVTTRSSESSKQHLTARISQWIKRQSNGAVIPTTYGSVNSGPGPGTVVGIVLGSVGGFLLILWLIYTCLNFGSYGSSSSYTESVVVRDRRKSHGSTRTRSRRASETVEIRRERSPARIIREEVRRAPPPPMERVIVEESRETRRERSRGGSDEVVVIEEHSPTPPRRSKSKRDSREVRESGFRTVDPLAYGGVVGGREKSRRGSGR